MRQHQILPLYTDEHTVTVAIARSVNLFMLDDLQLITGKQVKLVQAARDMFYTSMVPAFIIVAHVITNAQRAPENKYPGNWQILEGGCLMNKYLYTKN